MIEIQMIRGPTIRLPTTEHIRIVIEDHKDGPITIQGPVPVILRLAAELLE